MPFQFRCNICSLLNEVASAADIDQEAPSCSHCQSNVRFRWIVHSLSTVFFGESLCLKDFPEAKQIRGIGLSDALSYASVLSDKLSYTNTFYHCEPSFDIKDNTYGEPSSLDFIVASEVFEHVTPPVQAAFDNLHRLLKPGGFIFFTTPWRPIGFTQEHFPDLFDWEVIPFRDGHVLLNRTATGGTQAFTNLRFHGGPGETLEMRIFAQSDLVRNFQLAGLVPRFTAESVPKFGIAYPNPWSLPSIVQRISSEEELPHRIQAPESQSQHMKREIASLYEQMDAHLGSLQQISERQLISESKLQELLRERALVKNSKWLKLGRRFGFGPNLD